MWRVERGRHAPWAGRPDGGGGGGAVRPNPACQSCAAGVQRLEGWRGAPCGVALHWPGQPHVPPHHTHAAAPALAGERATPEPHGGRRGALHTHRRDAVQRAWHHCQRTRLCAAGRRTWLPTPAERSCRLPQRQEAQPPQQPVAPTTRAPVRKGEGLLACWLSRASATPTQHMLITTRSLRGAPSNQLPLSQRHARPLDGAAALAVATARRILSARQSGEAQGELLLCLLGQDLRTRSPACLCGAVAQRAAQPAAPEARCRAAAC